MLGRIGGDADLSLRGEQVSFCYAYICISCCLLYVSYERVTPNVSVLSIVIEPLFVCCCCAFAPYLTGFNRQG